MNPLLLNEEHEVKKVEMIQSSPAVSLILPFEPKMMHEDILEQEVKEALGRVEKELLKNYPAEEAMPVLLKLHALVRSLNYTTHRKSIALFASPKLAKVFYLDIPVEEKLVIDESFEIRDLVYSHKRNIQYLVLVLSAEKAKTYLGNCSKFIRLHFNLAENVHAYVHDAGEPVANFSDSKKRKEILLDKFLRHIDEGLSVILKAYPLPVCVIGSPRICGHFRKISRNTERVSEYIHRAAIEADETEIRSLVAPWRENWSHVRDKDLLQQLEAARHAGKAAAGIQEISKIVNAKNNRLLLVEKDFTWPVKNREEEMHYREADHPFYQKDQVDEIMEKVFHHGGDVEFVANGALAAYGRIALIRFWQ